MSRTCFALRDPLEFVLHGLFGVLVCVAGNMDGWVSAISALVNMMIVITDN